MLIQSKRHLKISVALACTFFILSACKSSEQLGGGTGIGSGAIATATVSASATPASVGASVDAEIYFKLDTAWDQSDAVFTHWTPIVVDGLPPAIPNVGACSVPRGAAPGTDGVPSVPHTCNFHFPEAQLYYSNVRFIYGTSDTTNCKYIKFDPYFYELNAGGTPPAPGTTPTPAPVPETWLAGGTPTLISCFGNAGGYRPVFPMGLELTELLIYLTSGCSNGPATTITGFPATNVGLLSETQLAQEFHFDVTSAFKNNQASNRWISNDTTNRGAAGSSYSGEYRLNSMHGYTVQCVNEFGVLTYEMSITITADHTTGPPAAIFKSWR